jgi:hypothetical protein
VSNDNGTNNGNTASEMTTWQHLKAAGSSLRSGNYVNWSRRKGSTTDSTTDTTAGSSRKINISWPKTILKGILLVIFAMMAIIGYNWGFLFLAGLIVAVVVAVLVGLLAYLARRAGRGVVLAIILTALIMMLLGALLVDNLLANINVNWTYIISAAYWMALIAMGALIALLPSTKGDTTVAATECTERHLTDADIAHAIEVAHHDKNSAAYRALYAAVVATMRDRSAWPVERINEETGRNLRETPVRSA